MSVPAIPYRGIQPFRYGDHAIFFARERESRLLASLVDVYRGVFLYGDSGNGKSSLVNAGLLPHARGLGFEPVRVRVQPRAGQELVIEQIAIRDDDEQTMRCVLAPEAEGLSRVVVSISEFEQRVRAASCEHQPLIVFDQFEEILTLFEDQDAVSSRLALAEMIVGLLREQLPVKLLFAFREDYLGRVKQLLAARPELVDQALRLGPPSADVLELIIRGPFERHPGHFERELDPALARRLCTMLAERFGNGEVSLSEVQTVCLRLWHAAQPETLLGQKKVQGLLEDELGEALDAFAADVRAAAVGLLSQMVTSAGTRNIISAEDLRQRVRAQDENIPPALIDQALDRLERESKLVRRERRRDLDLYEITSEFLVPWISQRREELRLMQERRRERRRLRILGAIASGLVILATLVTIIVLGQRAEAQHQRAAAQRQATDATSLALAASSGEPLKQRPDVSLALAFEAYRERPRVEARSAVIPALLEARRIGLRGVLTSNHLLDGVAFSPDGMILASAGADGVQLWDPATRTELGHLGDRTNWTSSVAFSADGKMLAAATAEGTVGLWDPTTHKRLGRLSGHNGPVYAVAFSSDGRILASGGDDGTVCLWDSATRKRLGRLGDQTSRVTSVAFSADDRILATADRKVRLWNPSNHKQLGTLTGHTGPVNSVAFSPDGKTLVTAGDDGTVRLWNPTSRTQVARLAGRAGVVKAVAFSPDGKTLVTAGDDRTVRLWNPTTHKLLDTLTGHSDWVSGVAFSPDGRTLASASHDETVRLWNPATRSRLGLLTGSPDTVDTVAFSPDDKTLASAGFDGTVHLWNPATRKQLGVLTGHGDPVFSIAFSPDGDTLASSGDDGTVRLSNPATRKRLGVLTDQEGAVLGVAFSPDGKTLASAGHDGTVRLWNPATGMQVARPTGHAGAVNAVAFSPDGKTLAGAGDDGTVRLWNPATGRLIARLTGHTGAVNAVAFSPEGKTLVSAGHDGIVRLWNPTTGRLIARFDGRTGAINAVAFSSDGKTLVTAGDDKTIRVWNEILWRNFAELRATVCSVLLGDLGRLEWALYAGGIRYHRSCP
ncbi:MAG: hypothetical protein QOI48_4651 [Solirubrobacteraceae bacterium]|nr:hypothetical protein [Solirubrobacteraceae bacterium]